MYAGKVAFAASTAAAASRSSESGTCAQISSVDGFKLFMYFPLAGGMNCPLMKLENTRMVISALDCSVIPT